MGSASAIPVAGTIEHKGLAPARPLVLVPGQTRWAGGSGNPRPAVPTTTPTLNQRQRMSVQKLLLNLEGQALADLQRLLAQTDAAIAERRVEELKVLADGYAKKLAMNGFAIREGMDALRPYLPRRKPAEQTERNG